MRKQVVAAFCLAGLAMASEKLIAQDFEVAPVKLMFDAEPATSQTKTISVKNHSSRRVSYTVAVADFLPSNTGEKKTLPPNSTKRSCANWLNINPSFFDLNPGEDIQVQVTMLVPGEEYGSTWCMLYIQPTTEQTSWTADKQLSTGITVTGRIGVQVYQSPKSNQFSSVKISNLQEITQPGDKLRRFSASVENLGDKVTMCKIFLLASNMVTAEERQFAAQNIEVFPKMSRNIELELPNDLVAGTYALAAIVDYGPKFPLEGTQIIIEVKGENRSINPLPPDTTSLSK
ncbi:MAG: hypothetical protein KBB29_09000 [Bacteroidales bacterium]|jgi:hypothetical protein|nr:hypothetical protein [Bacteroidales bacterium]MBP8644147.1 hypothetical protein [Bacteroidales bacterium]HNT41415.1 hypothetical protein [Tenuifilaceae bacterium]HPH00468.1 hypothetical protein [Tenuifilaceae bacterium]HPS04767.1 hypothetical protein [Tenuifilaceae bacterium]